MEKEKIMKTKELRKLILNSNYTLVRESKHSIFKHNVTKATLALPNHQSKEMNHHLLAGILKQIKRDNGGL